MCYGPDDRKTPAYTKQDGLGYAPMREWKNSLINLLNIAGTGPILGPIQGILFGPIAFITTPIRKCHLAERCTGLFFGNDLLKVRRHVRSPEMIRSITATAVSIRSIRSSAVCCCFW